MTKSDQEKGERQRFRDREKRREREFIKELALRDSLQNDQLGYMVDHKLIHTLEALERYRQDKQSTVPVDAIDLEKMIKEILKWRRGMLTKQEIKKYFAR